MRIITVKYEGTCKKCGNTLKIGEQANYEKYTGIFCIGCEPTDPEEIRAYRQERADKKADKYEEWAEKRRQKANAVFKLNERFTSDIAFNTQPGHMPFRDRIIKQEHKQHESLEIAKQMEEKAESLRHVRVAGDAERNRQKQREEILKILKIDNIVDTILYGIGKVIKINSKTASIHIQNKYQDYNVKVDLSWIKILNKQEGKE